MSDYIENTSCNMYPCGKCSANCEGVYEVGCDLCDTWYHTKCEKINKRDFNFLQKSSLSYTCSTCCTNEAGNYNFDAALCRLSASVKDDNLEQAAKLESILMRNVPKKFVYTEPALFRSEMNKDTFSTRLLGPSSLIPVSVKGDGNCLFNALSVAVQGNEDLAQELRVRTCLEMVENQAFYLNEHMKDRIECVSPSLAESTKDCALDHAFSSAWTMHAAATVLSTKIRSLYPAVNGIVDSCVGILNVTFNPRLPSSRTNEISIMWSGKSSNDKYWIPNHFVPLLPPPQNGTAVDLSDVSPVKGKSSSPWKTLDLSNSFSNICESDFPPLSPSKNIFWDQNKIPLEKCEASAAKKAKIESVTDMVTESDIEMESFDSEGNENLEISHPYKNPTENGLKGKFLSTPNILDIILNTENVSSSTIPIGIKENVYFIVKNEKNHLHTVRNQRRDFSDDCGAWQGNKNSCKTTHYVMSSAGALQTVVKRNNVYCKEVRKKFIQLEPQPEEGKVLILRRYYSCLAKDNEYKRRVSWFENLPAGYKDRLSVEVFEYIGKYPGKSVHGKSKHTTQPYTRTTVNQRAVIEEEVKHGKKPIEIVRTVNKSDPENPIDIRVAQNAKYRLQRSERPAESSRKNMADEMQDVISQLQGNDFIKSVIASSDNKPPSVICYNNEQFVDFKQSITNGSIVGIDRTFNLGACYVTCIVYQHKNLVRKGNQTSPIMLGPVFLHWDGLYTTYCDFLSNIRSHLGFSINQNQLVFGTDEEKALINAIKTCFPYSTYILCTRHLQENTNRNLMKQNVDEKTRNKVIHRIFGTGGLLEAEDRVIYSELEMEILEEFKNLPYLQDRLLPSLKENVFLPRMNNPNIPVMWKNNNCESMNNKIKVTGDWKKSKLPDVIERMKEIEIEQQINMRGALHGRGSFELAPHARSLFISHDVWLQMNNEQRKKQQLKLSMFNPVSKQCVTSSNGLLSIPCTSSLARKPGQTKRVRNAKTRTVPKKL